MSVERLTPQRLAEACERLRTNTQTHEDRMLILKRLSEGDIAPSNPAHTDRPSCGSEAASGVGIADSDAPMSDARRNFIRGELVHAPEGGTFGLVREVWAECERLLARVRELTSRELEALSMAVELERDRDAARATAEHRQATIEHYERIIDAAPVPAPEPLPTDDLHLLRVCVERYIADLRKACAEDQGGNADGEPGTWGNELQGRLRHLLDALPHVHGESSRPVPAPASEPDERLPYDTTDTGEPIEDLYREMPAESATAPVPEGEPEPELADVRAEAAFLFGEVAQRTSPHGVAEAAEFAACLAAVTAYAELLQGARDAR